jgi:hypothetical protein
MYALGARSESAKTTRNDTRKTVGYDKFNIKASNHMFIMKNNSPLEKFRP